MTQYLLNIYQPDGPPPPEVMAQMDQVMANVNALVQEAKDAGCWVYGAAAGAATNYDQPDYTGGVVMVLGGEGKGLRPRVASMCDDLVSLPLRGRIESLNVSATAAVLLYTILQSRLDTST